MGSIGSTLNSINSSLLSEIQALSSTSSSSSTAAATQSAASSDQVNFSQAADLFKQLQQLQTSNPTEFKQVLTDAATKLQTAATQQTDSQAASFLNNLASRFQTAANTGDLSALHPQSPSGTSGTHHGHHGHKAAGNDGDADDNTSSSSTSSTSSTTAATNNNANLLSLLNPSGSSQSPQDAFSILLSGSQNGSSPQDLLSAILNSGTQLNGSNSNQIQGLLASFVTSSPTSL